MRFSFLPPLARFSLLGVGSLLLGLAACNTDNDPVLGPSKAITFTQAGLYPEGTQYDDQRARFLVSSQKFGRIGLVDDAGTYTTFADDDRLISTVGLNLDAARNRLLAAVSDLGYDSLRTSATTEGKLAAVAIFDRSTGTLTQYLDLGKLAFGDSAHFANDIAVDAQGNAYVTDSYAPVIYKIDNKRQPNATATPWLTNPAFRAPKGVFGLNGIVYHPSGYLLVAKSDKGQLLKVPIANGSGGTPTSVTLPAGLDLKGDDGLQLLNNTTLLVVCNAQGKVYKLSSADDFATVTQNGMFPAGSPSPYPTTLARRTGSRTAADTTYVLYSHLNALQGGNRSVSSFTLQPLRF